MSNLGISVIVASVVLVAAAVVVFVIGQALLRRDTGRHGENMSSQQLRSRPVSRVTDDTQPMSSFDRRAYIRSVDRMAEDLRFAHEDSWALDNEQWAEAMRQMFAESYRIDRYLDSEVLAFPEWIWAQPKERITA